MQAGARKTIRILKFKYMNEHSQVTAFANYKLTN